jgi:hypothetical protein
MLTAKSYYITGCASVRFLVQPCSRAADLMGGVSTNRSSCNKRSSALIAVNGRRAFSFEAVPLGGCSMLCSSVADAPVSHNR